MTKEYRKPKGVRIAFGPESRELYGAEDKAVEAIMNATRRLGMLMGWGKDQLYTHALPEELYVMFDRLDLVAVELAAAAFLEARGYKVEKPEE